jgi:hexosaminidase
VLALDSSLDGEAYVVDVDRVAVVSGRDYQAMAFATATLLQAVRALPAPASLPRFVVRDAPDFEHRGLMLDLARNFHPIEVLKSVVVLCRHYKVRFLHLHLTDDQSFTFPSTAYPAVTTPGASYTLAEMRELESFAHDRGVEIIPEVDMPGHSTALARAAPDVFDCDPPLGMICPARAGVDAALDTLIGEVMDAFPSARYFHLGADEVNFAAYDQSAPCQAFMAEQGIADGHALYESFVARAVALVKARGRQPIVWEGFRATASVPVPRDTKVMVFESQYATAPELLAQGFQVINTSWQPLYVVNDRSWSPEYIYGWNVQRWEHFTPTSKAYPNGIMIDPTPDLLGAELCAWEQVAEIELPTTRLRVAAMSERIYNASAGRSYADFAARLAATDDALSRLLQ